MHDKIKELSYGSMEVGFLSITSLVDRWIVFNFPIPKILPQEEL